MRPRQLARSALALLLLALFGCSGNQSADTAAAQLQFGVEMARRELWQEALFRFRQAERMDPNNPRVYNNLAVAYEANGEFDKALEYYQKALRAAPDNRETRGNYARFVEFYQAFKPKKEGEKAPEPPAGTPGEGAAPESVPSTPPAAPPHQPAATPEARPQEPAEQPPPPPAEEPPPPPPPPPRTA